MNLIQTFTNVLFPTLQQKTESYVDIAYNYHLNMNRI
jgi:hypothetical protein